MPEQAGAVLTCGPWPARRAHNQHHGWPAKLPVWAHISLAVLHATQSE